MEEPTYDELVAEAKRHEQDAKLAALNGAKFGVVPFRGGKLFWGLRTGTCQHEPELGVRWSYLADCGGELTTYLPTA